MTPMFSTPSTMRPVSSLSSLPISLTGSLGAVDTFQSATLDSAANAQQHQRQPPQPQRGQFLATMLPEIPDTQYIEDDLNPNDAGSEVPFHFNTFLSHPDSEARCTHAIPIPPNLAVACCCLFSQHQEAESKTKIASALMFSTPKSAATSRGPTPANSAASSNFAVPGHFACLPALCLAPRNQLLV